MKSQKTAVIELVQAYANPETKVFPRSDVLNDLALMLERGEVAFSKPEKLQERKYVDAYVSGLLDNWLRKAKELEGYSCEPRLKKDAPKKLLKAAKAEGEVIGFPKPKGKKKRVKMRLEAPQVDASADVPF